MGTRRAPGRVGLLECSEVVLCTTTLTMRGRTQDTDSEVAPYKSLWIPGPIQEPSFVGRLTHRL